MKKLGEKREAKKAQEVAAFAALPTEIQEATLDLERVKSAKAARGCLIALTVVAGLGFTACGAAAVIQACRSESGTGGTGGVSDADAAAFGTTSAGAYC